MSFIELMQECIKVESGYGSSAGLVEDGEYAGEVVMLVDEILDNIAFGNGLNVNEQDADGRSALMWAIDCEMTMVARALVSAGADVHCQDKRRVTALHAAMQQDDIELVDLLLVNGSDINARDDQGITPLHMAAEHGRNDVINLLLDNGAQVDAKDNFGCTSLHLAARQRGRAHTVELLVARGAGVTVRNNTGELPLDCIHTLDDGAWALIEKCPGQEIPGHIEVGPAAFWKMEVMGVPAGPLRRYLVKRYNLMADHHMHCINLRRMLKRLLESGVDPQEPDDDGNTLVHELCKAGASKEDLRLVVDAGADAVINQRNNEGDSPLHCYLKSNKATTGGLEVLIARGADVQLRDGAGTTAHGLVGQGVRERAALQETLGVEGDANHGKGRDAGADVAAGAHSP